MSSKEVNDILPKIEPIGSIEVNAAPSTTTTTTATSVKRKASDANSKTNSIAKAPIKRRKKSSASAPNTDDPIDINNDEDPEGNDENDRNGKNGAHGAAGHRPVTSCTHCRQHKIKCNASEKFPEPCSRCQRMNLKCEIDPQFRPKKGSQIQSLRHDVDELRSKIEFLTRNEALIAKVLQNTTPQSGSNDIISSPSSNVDSSKENSHANSPSLIAKTHLQKEPVLLSIDGRSNSTQLINDSASNKADLNAALEAAVRNVIESPAQFDSPGNESGNKIGNEQDIETSGNTTNRGTKLTTHVNTKPIVQGHFSPNALAEFALGDVKISLEKAQTLHKRFVENYLPYLPIMISHDPIELYQQSQLLFWTVMLTACLSDPEPSLYNSFASLIKQLAIETCWIRTPRSTHIVQSLLILGTWPLPNQKVLDDCSYRFIGLAKSLSLQLGLHRGKFMTEFSRTQVALPDAEKWRSRTWLAVFFAEQFWSSNLGLPPSLQTDYLLENARIDSSLPKTFRCLISLAIFQAKLVNIMGLNVSSPDGLMEPANRAGPLHIMERELERLAFKLQIDDLVVEIYYLYVKLMVCLFSFLPETPSEDQTKFVTIAYHSATRIVTIMSKLLEKKQLTEYPIYVRHSVTTAAFLLFRLHLTPYLLPRYIDSSRQSIVTVHRLFRNMLAAWKDVENDISRTATVLEKLNFVIITHPELFTDTEGIIVRMRSHLTGSLFYDLVWNIHEARRRTLAEAEAGDNKNNAQNANVKKERKALPLPFYNQITKDDFTARTTTTPNGTTVTTLVPTDQAITNAKATASKAGLSKPTEINGIPLAMLEATGSLFNKQGYGNSGIITNAGTKKRATSKQSVNRGTPVPLTQTAALSSLASSQAAKRREQYMSRKQAEPTRMQRSTSMSAGANGLVPPPLFPQTTKMTRTVSHDSGAKNIQEESSTTTVKANPYMMNVNEDSTLPNVFRESPLANVQTPGMTPVGMNGLDSLFESPRMPTEGGISEMAPQGQGANQDAARKLAVRSSSQSPAGSELNEMFIDSIFQQNSGKPMEDDDLLGWFDMNMAPEF
jgi:hypothetical protein